MGEKKQQKLIFQLFHVYHNNIFNLKRNKRSFLDIYFSYQCLWAIALLIISSDYSYQKFQLHQVTLCSKYYNFSYLQSGLQPGIINPVSPAIIPGLLHYSHPNTNTRLSALSSKQQLAWPTIPSIGLYTHSHPSSFHSTAHRGASTICSINVQKW